MVGACFCVWPPCPQGERAQPSQCFSCMHTKFIFDACNGGSPCETSTSSSFVSWCRVGARPADSQHAAGDRVPCWEGRGAVLRPTGVWGRGSCLWYRPSREGGEGRVREAAQWEAAGGVPCCPSRRFLEPLRAPTTVGRLPLPTDALQQLLSSPSLPSPQVHYNNPKGLADQVDSTGFILTLTSSLRPKDLRVITLGQMRLSLPPGQASVKAPPNVCTASCTKRSSGP